MRGLLDYAADFQEEQVIKLNLIIVYSADERRVLMCRRTKPPYSGKFNFVGGKVEDGEREIDAAYRELFEETGISSCDIRLTHVINFQYLLSAIELEVFAGRLSREIALREEANPLFWIDRQSDFCDTSRFAGDCNIEHMLCQVDFYRDVIFQA